jgi:hypothetical protein
MRKAILFLLLGVVSLPVTPRLHAQIAPSTTQKPAYTQPPAYDMQDGGTRTTLHSIVVPPKANAPFTTSLQTEWVRTFDDGGSVTMVNERRIARDAKGRIYQERWWLVPKDGKEKSFMNAIEISDPEEHTLYTCRPQTHVCDLTFYGLSASATYQAASSATGPLPNDEGYAIHEDLGQQWIAGVETVGTRESTTYNQGAFGNDRKYTASREFWFSPQLGFNMLSKRTDLRFGTQTFTIVNLSLGEPDSQLFALPEGFTVVDHRTTAQSGPSTVPSAPSAPN